jgi:hypothetical protein
MDARVVSPEVQNPKSERSPKSECQNEFSTASGKVRLKARTNPKGWKKVAGG